MKCAWCGRENEDVGLRILMSLQHPACSICYVIWYDRPGISPKELVEISRSVDSTAEALRRKTRMHEGFRKE